jgi:hypothetical protein
VEYQGTIDEAREKCSLHHFLTTVQLTFAIPNMSEAHLQVKLVKSRWYYWQRQQKIICAWCQVEKRPVNLLIAGPECALRLTRDLPPSPPRDDGWLTSKRSSVFRPPLHSTVRRSEGVPLTETVTVRAITSDSAVIDRDASVAILCLNDAIERR